MRMPKARKPRRVADAYRFPGFRTPHTVHGIFGDAHARLICLVRRGKKPSAERAGQCIGAGTTAGNAEHEICPVAIIAFTSSWRCDAFSAVGAAA